ncbi:GNAT family N-acetyltransferase [Nitrosomonas communis]|uniref:2-polyprenyl-3-methyl-5-hydroxy-6-metoxy-1,4-benzoquinol methylase n=1 Tax=Nitrosomonas communis TaxID=44574 RepID=A0A1I4PBH3_9PROT|nr:GNAT family N-acetyltransferase [Nitrosomonas communis]SFM24990.1 2-polyprenyl-3-methyl-5-hydroxy-6-metoxy-1,4-benzoquinol methylase [Nitrosomonas communis]
MENKALQLDQSSRLDANKVSSKNKALPYSYHGKDVCINSETASPSPYKDLSFPLNVFAHVLLIQEGRADYLHYGLFQENQTDLRAAQQYSTDLLLNRLPVAPCRILEVGIGLGTTFSLLIQKGYQVYGITPDAQQIALIHKRLGTQIQVACQRLEDFEAAQASFDVLLFQESAQYIEPLVIFNKGLDLLPEGGSLLIIDEFALGRVEAGVEGLHLLSDMLALAYRLGFELVEQLDLSRMAAPTLDYLLYVTARQRQRLMADLSLNAECLKQLEKSNRLYQEKYACGRFGYALLHFRKKQQPRWRLRLLEKNQIPDMLALFERTFGHSMTPAMWQWKYGAGRGRAIGVWHENQLIAHYGGIVRKIFYFGQPQIAVQIGDVMVDSAERGILTKKGPFFLMSATFLENYIGYGKPYLLGFGFPNERAMKVAERQGLYAETGHMSEIEWQPLAKTPRWLTRLYVVDSFNVNEAWIATAIAQCWQGMAADLQEALVGVRDWTYVRDRYLTHPHQHYQVVLVINRFGRKVRGVLVLRHNPEGCEITDLISPLKEIPLLVLHARRIAGMNSHPRLSCQITENFASYFVATGGIQQALSIRIPANAWSAGPAVETLRNRWWLMSGDMDFR